MTKLVIWALLAGHPVTAEHLFGDPAACERERAIIRYVIEQKGASAIVIFCTQEPAL